MTMDPCMVGFQCSLCMSLCVCLSQCLNVAFFRIETDRSGETRSLYLTGCTCVCVYFSTVPWLVGREETANSTKFQKHSPLYVSVCLTISDCLFQSLSVSVCLYLSLSV